MAENDGDLSLRTNEHAGVVVIMAGGEIDSSNCVALQDMLTAVAQRPATLTVEVDLADVSFIDSSGLRALIIGQRAISEAAGSMRVTAASDSVRRLFEITGLVERLGLTT